VTELAANSYKGEIARCTDVFFKTRGSAVTYSLDVNDETDLSFDMRAEGQSPSLSISDPHFREKLWLDIKVARSFSGKAIVQINSQQARQTPSPESDSSKLLPSGRFTAFNEAQEMMLTAFVRSLVTSLQGCIGTEPRKAG
jgi:hypothetical protein